MLYCQDKTQAILTYKFPGKAKETCVFKNPPIEVNVESSLSQGSVRANYDFEFDGLVEKRTYSFTCLAPAGVPGNADIFLISGTWDDWGSIGTYSTGYGIVKSYSGGGELIGKGISVPGTVVNERMVNCYARLTLEFRFGGKYVLNVLKDGGIIYQDSANKYPEFTVACGDECPEGYCKCASTNYPGYCCLPCSEVKSGLLAIARNIL